LVIHKAVTVNEWCGEFSVEIDKSCPHCGPQSVEYVEHMFYSCPLAQHGWRYAANILWQLFAIRKNLGPQNSFSMMQCLFDQPLCKTLKRFSRIWFSKIWFSTICNGLLKKHVKSFGTPYRIMVGLS
jgi:hypothetical protein